MFNALVLWLTMLGPVLAYIASLFIWFTGRFVLKHIEQTKQTNTGTSLAAAK